MHGEFFFPANFSVGDALTNQSWKVGGKGSWGGEGSLMGTRPSRAAAEEMKRMWSIQRFTSLAGGVAGCGLKVLISELEGWVSGGSAS